MPYGYRGGPGAGGESVLASALSALNDVVDQKLEQRRLQRDEDRKTAATMRSANMQIGLGMAQLDASMADQEQDRKDKVLAAAVAARKDSEKRERDALAFKLREKFGATQDPRLVPMMQTLGASKTDIDALRPPTAPVDPRQRAYETAQGRLQAEKETGTGAFKPKAAPNAAAGMSSVEAARQARSGIQTHLDKVVSTPLNSPRYSGAEALVAEVVQDPAYAKYIQDGNFQQQLRAQAAKAITDANAAKMKATGKKKGFFGGAAAARQ